MSERIGKVAPPGTPQRAKRMRDAKSEFALEHDSPPKWTAADVWWEGRDETRAWYGVGKAERTAPDPSWGFAKAEQSAKTRLTEALRPVVASEADFESLRGGKLSLSYGVPIEWALDATHAYALVVYSPYWDVVVAHEAGTPAWAQSTEAPDWVGTGFRMATAKEGHLLYCGVSFYGDVAECRPYEIATGRQFMTAHWAGAFRALARPGPFPTCTPQRRWGYTLPRSQWIASESTWNSKQGGCAVRVCLDLDEWGKSMGQQARAWGEKLRDECFAP